jgi:hypothetical protein
LKIPEFAPIKISPLPLTETKQDHWYGTLESKPNKQARASEGTMLLIRGGTKTAVVLVVDTSTPR